MNQFMALALEEGLKGMNEGKGGPFGAVVVKDNVVIAKGANEVLAANDPTAHAEMVAIRLACQALGTYDLSGCELYATGEPCPMCLSAIIWANIRKVYYSNTVKAAEAIGFRDDLIYRHLRGEEMALEIEQLDEGSCLKLYEMYQEQQKTIY